MSQKNYRIRTNISSDKVVHAPLTQDINFLEILSLKIDQSNSYKLHTSNYGVIVGRVLANEAFGIPNAKVSVFIPLTEDDTLRSDILNRYPYLNINDKDSNNIRYNLLKDESNDKCYRVVGTFPNKRLVLDNNTEIEVYEKYWKYTTITNQSGDYMIFGVPIGKQQVHVDVDLSDIGVLSQKPRDFMYKGYNATQFDNANQFKESTNLDDLSQILTQTSSVHVYPFWGDSDAEEIAITRCDLQVQYKFEPTCVFFGSIVSDNFSNDIGDKCNPSKYVGFNRNLVAGEGTIEMIRKTPDGLIEEFQIQGNRLIDGNGVWCYQIPMNLDFVGTDEYGNIVPTDNPKKGIPTKTSVRFRVSMQETNNEGVSRHRAKYLIPNVHQVVDSSSSVRVENPNSYNQCYEFGSATPNEFFRDLYWNKVYSVKNYIPRIQTSSARNTQRYSAIRTVNSSGNLNPMPFNRARFKLFFSYKLLCILFEIVASVICVLNGVVKTLACSFCIPLGFVKICPLGWLCSIGIRCISISSGVSEDDNSNVEYFPCCSGCHKCCKCKESGCVKDTNLGRLMDKVQQTLAQEYDTINLDFYNDWLNGCLYLPLWFWKKTKKKKYLFGLFSKKAVNRYCNCDSIYKTLKVTENCSLEYDSNYNVTNDDNGTRYHYKYPSRSPMIGHGIIKEVENNDGLKVYYYSPGIPTIQDYQDTTAKDAPYVRLFSTDIILLGSLNDCDIDNLPRPFLNLPSTTANIPYISTMRDDSSALSEGEEANGTIEVTGMDWLGHINSGLLMDLSCSHVETKPKSCINVARLSELGVSLDSRYFDSTSTGSSIIYKNERPADGMVTRYEIIDNETRAMFASLNHNGLTQKMPNVTTGYDTYKLTYVYPTDFDGHLNRFAPIYTRKNLVKTYDNQDKAYKDFKLGLFGPKSKVHYYSSNQFPLFNNSFYFYFGLNEGNTAIDKFNNMFYSSCYKNYKYPFKMSYSVQPAQWCKEWNGNKVLIDGNYIALSELNKDFVKDKLHQSYASISIDLNGIKTPFKYELYDEFNTLLMSEDGMSETNLRFGYEVSSNGGQYVTNNSGAVNKYGVLTYINTGKTVVLKHSFTGNENDEIDAAYLVNNGAYKIKVTDAVGETVVQNMSISQVPINMDITSIALGDKYYPGNSTHDDLCNEFRYNGEIIINDVNIDGRKYAIKSVQEIDSIDKDYDSYKLTLQELVTGDVKDIQHAILSVRVLQFIEDGEGEYPQTSFDDCTCHNKASNLPPKYEVANGELRFNVWVPGNYEMTITQLCNGEENDNTSSEIINVANGTPFNVFINEVPLKFVLGNYKNSTPHYNDMFYPAINSGTTLHPHDKMSKDLTGWFNLHKESTYQFPSLRNENDGEVWQDFIDVEMFSPVETDPTKLALTVDSQINMISYKLMCMMNMCMNYYISDTAPKTANLTHTGGKAPILYRCMYPSYDDMSQQISRYNPISTVTYNGDGVVSAVSNAPNIVGGNYTQYISGIGAYTNDVFHHDPNRELYENYKDFSDCTNCGDKSDRFNPHFNMLLGRTPKDARKQGNYFAVFTSNGGMKKVLDEETNTEKWVFDSTVKHMQMPQGTSSYIEGVNPGETISIGGGYNSLLTNTNVDETGRQTTPYFRTMFLDLRMDYDLLLFMPIYNNSLTNIKTTKKYGNLWKNGRIVGYIHNPLELAYDTNKNIIGVDSNDTASQLYEYTLPQIYADNEHIIKFSDCGPKHDYNEFFKVTYNDKANRRLFDGYVRCDGWSLDIKDKLLSSNRTNIKPFGDLEQNPNTIQFYKPNPSVYNGTLNDGNYPLKRWIDIANIPTGNQFKFSATPCKYLNTLDAQTSIVNANNEMPINYNLAIDGGDELSFTIGLDNTAPFYEPSNPENESTKFAGNIMFSYDPIKEVFVPSYEIYYEFKLPTNGESDSHKTFTYTPFVFSAYYQEPNGERVNVLEQLALVKDGSTTENEAKSLNDIYQEYTKILFQHGYEITDQDHIIVGDNSEIGRSWGTYGGYNGDLLDTTNIYYWVNSANRSNILYDDDSFTKTVRYRVNKYTMRDYILPKHKGCLILGIAYIRQFVTTSNDNLTKSVTTLNLGNIIDLRNADMICSDAKVSKFRVENEDGEMVDKEFQTTTFQVITHSQGDDFDLFTSQFTNDSATNYSGVFQTQSKITHNVQFKFGTVDKTYNGKVVKEKCLTISVIWDEGLDGIKLTDGFSQTFLYVQTPARPIAMFKFSMNKFGQLSKP